VLAPPAWAHAANTTAPAPGACRQSGLSVVHTELLDFDGDEIYIAEAPTLVGRTLGEALFLYPESSVIRHQHSHERGPARVAASGHAHPAG